MMSIYQKTFRNWILGIASALIIAGIIGIVSLGQIVAVNSEKAQTNSTHIKAVRADHKTDNDLIREEMWNIRADQKIIMQDIKEILKELK